jgi:myo-inositol-1-phosphate synthase
LRHLAGEFYELEDLFAAHENLSDVVAAFFIDQRRVTRKLSDVIPAKAGIHFDFASAFASFVFDRAKIKMDPSFRWDDVGKISRYERG